MVSLSMSDREIWLSKALDVIASIYEQDFYVSIWESVAHKQPITELEKRDILKPFQDFWNTLPDTPYIRREPFFAICDLAEEYMFGDEPFIDEDLI